MKLKTLFIIFIIVLVAIIGTVVIIHNNTAKGSEPNAGSNTIAKSEPDEVYGNIPSSIPQEETTELAVITATNWGEVCTTDDFWSKTQYVVYRNGEVYSYDFYNLSGKKNEKYKKISSDKVTEIEKLLKDNIDRPSDLSSCDGEGWEFIYMDENRDIVGKYNGYIYGIADFEKIVDILK